MNDRAVSQPPSATYIFRSHAASLPVHQRGRTRACDVRHGATGECAGKRRTPARAQPRRLSERRILWVDPLVTPEYATCPDPQTHAIGPVRSKRSRSAALPGVRSSPADLGRTIADGGHGGTEHVCHAMLQEISHTRKWRPDPYRQPPGPSHDVRVHRALPPGDTNGLETHAEASTGIVEWQLSDTPTMCDVRCIVRRG